MGWDESLMKENDLCGSTLGISWGNNNSKGYSLAILIWYYNAILLRNRAWLSVTETTEKDIKITRLKELSTNPES